MKNFLYLCCMFFFTSGCFGQTKDKVQLQKNFNKKVNNLLSLKVPFISVGDLDANFSDYVILDSREKEEYEVGHINGARHVGYDNFDVKNVTDINKDTKIAVYCSIGYRSEKITKKLREAGYKNAFNVYGSIFQWVNEEKPIYNSAGERVKEVHTYNKKWSKWVFSEDIKKTW